MTNWFNEGKACDAIVRFLEEREGQARRDLRFPENEGHDDPIEMSCVLGDQLIALEHTGIEPFSGHIQNGEQLRAFMAPIEERLLKTLPDTESYELVLPIDAVRRMNRVDVPLIQQRLIDWVESVASSHPLFDSSDEYLSLDQVSIAGVPFPVWLEREGNVPAIAPLFSFGPIVSDRSRSEEERLERIRAGYAKKMKKLSAWKRDRGARTILILENADISHTRADLVAKAVSSVVNEALERPDELFLVTTCLRRWRVFPILRDETFFNHIDAKPRWVIDRDTLNSLTGR